MQQARKHPENLRNHTAIMVAWRHWQAPLTFCLERVKMLLYYGVAKQSTNDYNNDLRKVSMWGRGESEIDQRRDRDREEREGEREAN